MKFESSKRYKTIYKSQMFNSAGLAYLYTGDMPCLWWRFWQWIFFGFKWRRINARENR